MKHIFFNQDNANGNGAIGNNMNFADNVVVILGIDGAGAINIGGGNILNFIGAAGDNIANDAGVIIGGAKILNANGPIALVDPIVEGAIVTISNPETTSLALSNLDLRDHQLQQLCPHLSRNSNIEFIDFSHNQISETGLQ